MSDSDKQSDKSFEFDREIFNEDFIDTDEFNVRIPRIFSSVNFNTDESSMTEQRGTKSNISHSNNNSSVYSEESHTLSAFSLGDVGAYLKLDIEASKENSMNTEDDDIAEELLNLNDLEKELALELEYVETCPTPDRKQSIKYMSNSENWVSHTPESKLKAELDEDEFASAADIGYIPPSPPNAFEKFFLPVGISQESTSSFAEGARRIQKNNISDNRRLISPYSITSDARTEDYASAEEEHSNASEIDDLSLEESTKSVLFNDVLGSPTILEETPEKTHEMSSTTPETMAEPTPTPVETVPEPTSEESTPEFDVVDHVYEGAKSVWSFGKGIIVFKPFMGVAEGVATRVLSITTGVSSLEDADKGIKCALSGVDKEFIDPAILQLWSLLEPIIGKGDDVLKTVMGFVSKDTPLLEAEEETVVAEETIPEPKLASKEESEEAIAPETSTPAVIA